MGGCFSCREHTEWAVAPLPAATGVAPDGVQHEYLGDTTFIYADYGGETGVSRNRAFLALRAASPTPIMYLPVLDNGHRLAFLVPKDAPQRPDTSRERLAGVTRMVQMNARTVKVARRTGRRAPADGKNVYDVYYARWRASERWTFLAPPLW